MLLTLFFVPHVLFYIFHLGKRLLALNTLIVIPVNLNLFLIEVRTLVLRFLEPINILACLI